MGLAEGLTVSTMIKDRKKVHPTAMPRRGDSNTSENEIDIFKDKTRQVEALINNAPFTTQFWQ